MKEPLNEVEFLIPVRVEATDRLENLLMIIDFILVHFSTKIRVLEVAPMNNGILSRVLPNEIGYSYERDDDPVFHRTFYINKMVRESDADIVAIWDSDVLTDPSQITSAINVIQSGKAFFSSPYSGKFLDTSDLIRRIYFRDRDIQFLKQNEFKMKPLYNLALGGGFFAKREVYCEVGLENEQFYGWGHEDGERVLRWNKLGYEFYRVPGVMYHLTHKRGDNSLYQTPDEKIRKMSMIREMGFMSSEEVKHYITTWT